MSNEFPIPDDKLDSIAYPLALEAVIGVALRNESDAAKAAHDWVETVLKDSDPSNQIKARAMHFVQRITHGPKPAST